MEINMYKYRDTNSVNISLHDCRAEHIQFEHGVLSFSFSEGFWILPGHPQNKSEDCVRTDASQVDFQIIDEDFDGITIYVFKKNWNGKTIREEWKLKNFLDEVNHGRFQVEFIDEYKSYQSRLFKCWLWFDVKPYHYECEIILRSENATYCWNELIYERVW